MARPIDQLCLDDPFGSAELQASRRLDRNVALAFAAAMSSLLIATLVITRSTAALSAEGTGATNSFEVGTIALSDDDQGRSLVRLDGMVPARPATECIDITYEGTILPVDVTLSAEAEGGLTPFVTVAIDRGAGGGFGACDTFVATGTVFRGSLSQLSAGGPLPVGTYRNQGDDLSFRFRFDLRDDAAAMGQAATVDFVWEARPS